MEENKVEKPANAKTGLGEGGRFLLIAAAAVIVMVGMREMRALLTPIMLGAFLAIISYSITTLLRNKLKWPHWLAVIGTVAVDLGIIFFIITVIRLLAIDMQNTLQSSVMERVAEKHQSLLALLDEWGMGDGVRAAVESPGSMLDTQKIMAFVQSAASQVVSFLSVTTLVLVLMTFLLGEAPLFLSNFRNRVHVSEQFKRQIINCLKGIQRYLLIKTIASAVTGFLAWILCCAMDVPFAFLWGIVAYVLNYIPTIGSIVAAVPPILLALLFGDVADAVVVAFGYIAINFAIGNGIEPLFLGKQFGIATSVVLLSVLTWGWVWGPCGMFLAVPITVLFKLALENSKDLYWVAAIIDDNKEAAQKPADPDTQHT